jgi:hypothetical protein
MLDVRKLVLLDPADGCGRGPGGRRRAIRLRLSGPSGPPALGARPGPRAPHLYPTTTDTGSARGSAVQSRKPVSVIQPMQSAPL